jgi:hypothetical protein
MIWCNCQLLMELTRRYSPHELDNDIGQAVEDFIRANHVKHGHIVVQDHSDDQRCCKSHCQLAAGR